MRIGEVWGAWAPTRCEDAVTRSERAADLFAFNTKAIDSIHPRARLNGSDRHIRAEVLYKCEDINTRYRELVGSCAHEKKIGHTVRRWLSDDLHMGDMTEH